MKDKYLIHKVFNTIKPIQETIEEDNEYLNKIKEEKNEI